MERFQINDQKNNNSNNNNILNNKLSEVSKNNNNRPLSAPALTGPNLSDQTDDT